MEKDNSLDEIRSLLGWKRSIVWKEDNYNQIMSFADEYKQSLNNGKTERKFTKYSEEYLLRNGFIKFDNYLNNDRPINGLKLYKTIKDKGIIAFYGGRSLLSAGLNIVAAHIDSPRLDLKQNPLFEDSGFSYLDTHYYGGIKVYQWLSMPLVMDGEIIKKDGSRVSINIGESDSDPVFVISDILPHLAREEKGSKVGDVFKAESLDIIVGSLPINYKEEEKDAIKLNILKILNEKYGIIEEDFSSAEIEIIPKGKAMDVGFDRSMILAYGQDDRICAYPALKAITEIDEQPELSSLVLLLDKEEIGSEGNTGAKTKLIEEFLEDLISFSGEKITVNKLLSKSNCLSGDVSAAYDPHYKDVFEEKNSARLNKGIAINKYTGVAGKSGSSDASAEFMGKIRNLFNTNSIKWQTAELGKVDVGGGGTVAKYFAERGMEVIDCGPSILSMHAPYEISSKADVYETYRAYLAFFKKFI